MLLRRLLPALVAGLLAGPAASLVWAEPLVVGQAAPEISAPDQDGKIVDLGQLYAKGDVLVYFYPKAGTSGCTAQACSLRDAYDKLTARGVTVVGVSADTEQAQKNFEETNHLPFILLADPGHTVIDAFGVPLFGAGLATRQAFLIRHGHVVWRDLTASTTKQAADVLAVLDSLALPPG